MNNKINAAESIRGLACLAVVFSHLSLSFFPDLHGFDQPTIGFDRLAQWIHHSPFAFWFSGTAAVYVFFVLSGYVLSYAICRDPKRIMSKTRQMLVKRYLRLAIPVLSSCLLVWLIFSTPAPDVSHVMPWLQEYLQQEISLSQALYQGSIGAFIFAHSSVNWVLWTMQIELFGSLLVFLLIAVRQYSVAASLGLGAMLLLLVVWRWGEGMLLGMGCFYVGMLLYFYASVCGKATAIFLFAFGLYLAGVHDNSWSYAWLHALLQDKTYDYANLLAAFLIVYSVLFNPKLSHMLDRRVFLYLGQWSFAIYLLHLPLLYLIAVPVLNQCLAWEWSPYGAQALCIFIYMTLLMLLAAVFSRYIDQFAIRCSQGLAQRVERIIQS